MNLERRATFLVRFTRQTRSLHRPAAEATAARSISKDFMISITQKDVVVTYRIYAPVYDWIFGAIFDPGRKVLADTVNALKPQKLLEIGVGTGLMLASYPASASIHGIDLSDDMLLKAQARANVLPRHQIQLARMDAESLEFPDHSFDCVTLPYVLSVTPNPNRLIAEARRVCRPDGSILIVNHFSGSSTWWLLEKSFRTFAKRIGFRPDFTYTDNILHHDWQVLSVRNVNLLSLSKFIHIKNTGDRT